jgi:peptidoglycan/xylan/chitin deacetylase (PgdA/CDA1 family)
VEDWFQVENLKSRIPVSTWHQRELRVEKNTRLILDLLDGVAPAPKATFFVLGWVADKCPDLVKEIACRGHEVASHGHGHQMCTQMDPKALAQDLEKSKKQLEDLAGIPISGYRYDASYNSFSGHGRYGILDLSGWKKQHNCFRLSPGFYEVPVSNLHVKGRVWPLGGGGYFRLMPFPFFKAGMHQVLKKENAFVFYAHPWEFDPDQPRVQGVPKWLAFRHYTGLSRTAAKLKDLITAFNRSRFPTITGFLAQMPC